MNERSALGQGKVGTSWDGLFYRCAKMGRMKDPDKPFSALVPFLHKGPTLVVQIIISLGTVRPCPPPKTPAGKKLPKANCPFPFNELPFLKIRINGNKEEIIQTWP
jgi:hypothetical protein